MLDVLHICMASVAIPEDFQRDELRQIASKNIWMAAEIMSQDLGRLAVFCEISARIPPCIALVHGEERCLVQLDNETARLLGSIICGGRRSPSVQAD